MEALINFYQIETCFWDTNDHEYAEIDKRTRTLQRIAEKLANKYSRSY